MLQQRFSLAQQWPRVKRNPIPKACRNGWTGGKYIKFEGLDIFVHSSGTAPVKGHGVLVVHGYPGSSWDFSNVVSQVEKKTKIVVLDMIGFGQSETPLTGTFKDNFSLLRQAMEKPFKGNGFSVLIGAARVLAETFELSIN